MTKTRQISWTQQDLSLYVLEDPRGNEKGSLPKLKQSSSLGNYYHKKKKNKQNEIKVCTVFDKRFIA